MIGESNNEESFPAYSKLHGAAMLEKKVWNGLWNLCESDLAPSYELQRSAPAI